MRHHLAVLSPDYLELILQGRKTVECRLLKLPRPPYRCVARGDVLWLKQSSGPICAVAAAGRVRDFDHLDPERITKLRSRWNEGICAAEEFWRSRLSCRYGTLLWLEQVRACTRVYVPKADRRAWVLLSGPPMSSLPSQL